MRPIRWLHISDFHLHEKQSSKQDAVLDAMLHDIKQRGDGDVIFDFVLVTGDLAFSGKESEYELVEPFFTKLSSTIGLSCNRIFCVPGNHDVDRSRQKMSFAGARRELRSQTDIYSFLANVEERETLLTRQANFRKFQERFFSDQPRNRTQDGLGYVSVIDVNEIRIAIIGLNSAWLAEGGQSDDRQLLIGEEQVRNAVKIVNTANPMSPSGWCTTHSTICVISIDGQLGALWKKSATTFTAGIFTFLTRPALNRIRGAA